MNSVWWGASQSIGLANTVTNAIVADTLAAFAARLESAADKAAEVRAIVADTWRDHGRIVFNGNNYSTEWRAEAARRGLPDIPDMVRAAAGYITEKNVAMFERTGVLTQAECHSRYEITLENYAKHIHIDAATMLEMAGRSILPASPPVSGRGGEGRAPHRAVRLCLRQRQGRGRKSCVFPLTWPPVRLKLAPRAGGHRHC